MGNYFAKNYSGEPFHIFGTPHLIVIAIVIFVNAYFIYAARREITEFHKSIGLILAIVLLVNEAGWNIWNAAIGEWTIQTKLPFHLCTIMVFLSAIMLLTKSYTLYEYVYFAGIGGAAQALLTPNIGAYGFPHYRFFEQMISHASIITAAIYMTTIGGFRPYRKSMLRVFVAMNIYLVVVGFINKLIGSNYMFVAHKPETPSLLDYLGPWPWYIVGGQLICLVTFIFLYAPFAFKDMVAKRTAAAQLS
jgi:hypothetical integral membrane protein (TIGR02206 family)